MKTDSKQSYNDRNPLVVIASNRGPFSFTRDDDGEYSVERGSGGLVTALGALAEQHEVVWVACAMQPDDRQWQADWQAEHPDEVAQVEGIYLTLVTPDQTSYDQYYGEISNPLLWFIQHQMWDIPRHPSITRETRQAWTEGYLEINREFAEAIAESVKQTLADGERPIIVLVQDYHLYMVPKYLREIVGDTIQVQHFLHIPWPGPDVWRILPKDMRNALLDSMLLADRLGFQTKRDAFNFVQTCRFYLEGAHSRGSRDSIHYQGRKIKAHAYPISIDIKKVDQLAQEGETQLYKSQILNIIGDRKLILRVDRIEPSKNMIRGLKAFQALLEDHPEHVGRVSMVALLVPSRMEVGEYQDYWRDVMAEAGFINSQFSDGLWEPVRILVGNNYPRALAAMQLYDVLLVNPIADGMNLVAKEGALLNQRDGVIILSEDAGAYYELGEQTLTVSPFDVDGMAQAMHSGLTMSQDERHERSAALKEIVRSADVREWFYAQVQDALTASTNQDSSDSTSETPVTKKSASSRTA
ncbi:MAG: trehalose-6-phosphate synthase [Chloroflexi bacterium]|nr:trehalose-6-phosphate synthase [Chloroflexota bacterium]